MFNYIGKDENLIKTKYKKIKNSVKEAFCSEAPA